MQTSFVPKTATTATGTVKNDGFFPDIDIAHFVSASRLNDTIPPDRLTHALETAIMECNRLLNSLKLAPTFTVSSDAKMGDVFVKVQRYRMAVYSLARVYLMEQMRDYDYTNQGDSNDLQPMIDNLQSNHADAINILLSRPTKFIKLI